MPYTNIQAETFGHHINEVREAYPDASIPDGADYGDFRWYEPVAPDFNPATHVAVEVAPSDGLQQWRLDPIAHEVQAAACWERIMTERDRRKCLGVKVGTNWFHSDDASRIQQLGMVLLGQSIPAGLQWKTLTMTPTPVFVDMTPALAVQIVQATAASDTAIFAAAEVHRIAMEALPDPGAYDFSGGWPISIEDTP